MNKKQQRIKRAIQNGYSPLDVAKMQAIAKHQAERMMGQAREEAFLDMLLIPVQVLAFDYWSKTAKKKMPEYIKEVLSLYDSVQAGAVTREELNEEFKNLCGIDLIEEWNRLREETEWKIRMRLYVAYYNDEYELPIGVAITIKELANMLHTTESSINNYLYLKRRDKIVNRRLDYLIDEVEVDD